MLSCCLAGSALPASGNGAQEPLVFSIWSPRGSHVLASPVRRNPTLALQLEKTHETPPSSRDDGLLLLYGLESNPESSLQTLQEA